jgi:vancomycin resistance protein YoaR
MSGPFLSTAARPRRRPSRLLVTLAVALGVVAVLAAALGIVWLLERDTIPRGTTIAGVPVGGLSEDDAREALKTAAAQREARPIALSGPGGAMTTSGAALRATPELDDALVEAVDASAADRVLARLGLRDGPQHPLTYRLAPVRAAELANRIDARFGDPPVDARVVVTDDAIRVVDAREGTAVDRRALRRALATLPSDVTLSVVHAAPVVSTLEAERAAARIERLLDGPRRVRWGDAEATLTPQRLRALVRTERADGTLAVLLDPKGLGASLRIRLGSEEVPARDAGFAVSGKRARVVPSRPGRTLDLASISRSLTSNLDSTVHRARFLKSPPALTTEAAESLGIEELVSEFTTYYPCCQPRVTNIQRAAQLLDGTIVRPRTAFSLNDALGKRTVENGFVSAPQIFAGRLEDAVGGGISQIATTLYNAAFFAGVKLVAHQAHQFYISRYPMGREATVSWGGPELIFRNDWPAAILMKVTATSSSITVRFYSRKLGRHVETKTGEPYAYVAPRTITVRNSALAPGTTSTVQSAGESGFTVQYTRKVFEGPKLVKDERYTVRYDAQNAIVEVGPPRAKPKPKPPPDASTENGESTEEPPADDVQPPKAE